MLNEKILIHINMNSNYVTYIINYRNIELLCKAIIIIIIIILCFCYIITNEYKQLSFVELYKKKPSEYYCLDLILGFY